MRTSLLLLDEVQQRPQGLSKAWLSETTKEIENSTPMQWRKHYREH